MADGEVNGIQQKIDTIGEIKRMISAFGVTPGDDRFAELLDDISRSLRDVDGCLSIVGNTIAAYRCAGRRADWDYVGRFRATAEVCDSAIGRTSVLLDRLQEMVRTNKVPVDVLPLVGKIVWVNSPNNREAA